MFLVLLFETMIGSLIRCNYVVSRLLGPWLRPMLLLCVSTLTTSPTVRSLSICSLRGLSRRLLVEISNAIARTCILFMMCMPELVSPIRGLLKLILSLNRLLLWIVMFIPSCSSIICWSITHDITFSPSISSMI